MLGAAAILFGLVCGSAFADETVSIGGSRAVLIKPKAPRASVILMPGGSGAIDAGDHGDIHGLTVNQLVRTRHAYAARGLAVLVVDASTARWRGSVHGRDQAAGHRHRHQPRHDPRRRGDCARRPAGRAGADIGIAQRRVRAAAKM